jgi:hypothetical protein
MQGSAWLVEKGPPFAEGELLTSGEGAALANRLLGAEVALARPERTEIYFREDPRAEAITGMEGKNRNIFFINK